MYKRRIVLINICTLYCLSTSDRISKTCICSANITFLVPVIPIDIHQYL